MTSEVQQRAHGLRMEALRVGNAREFELEVLRQQLSSAEEELRHYRVLERVLLKEVAEQETRAARAEHRYLELQEHSSVLSVPTDLVDYTCDPEDEAAGLRS